MIVRALRWIIRQVHHATHWALRQLGEHRTDGRRLPTKFYEAPIGCMSVGDVAYTTPWTLKVDDDGECWIKTTATLTNEQCGTSCMRVERREDGLHVWPPNTERYEPSGSVDPERCWRVAEVHGAAHEHEQSGRYASLYPHHQLEPSGEGRSSLGGDIEEGA